MFNVRNLDPYLFFRHGCQRQFIFNVWNIFKHYQWKVLLQLFEICNFVYDIYIYCYKYSELKSFHGYVEASDDLREESFCHFHPKRELLCVLVLTYLRSGDLQIGWVSWWFSEQGDKIIHARNVGEVHWNASSSKGIIFIEFSESFLSRKCEQI